MKRGWIIGLIIVVILVAGGGLYLMQKNSTPSTSSTANATPTSAEQSPQGVTATNAPTTPSVTTSQNMITLTANGFSPTTLTIKAGQTVVWKNTSGDAATVNSDPHPTHTIYPPLNLGQFSDGATLTLTFTTPGTYGYHNHFNPRQRGTIIVQ